MGIPLSVSSISTSSTLTKSKAGVDGAPGDSIAVVNAYLRKATLPDTPSGDTLDEYNFTTKILTPPSIAGGSSDNWSDTVPAGTDPLYVISATAEISGTTGTDTTLSWSAPQILASDGVDGDNAVQYYIKPTSGTAIKNSQSTLELKGMKIDGGIEFDFSII